MKKLIASIAVFLLLIYGIVSCEKDDICAEGTPTTPSVVIEFYENENREELKNITNLKLYTEGVNDTLPAAGQAVTFNRITIPLKTNEQTTKWFLQYSIPNTSIVNTDVITFNYTSEEIYVSRACGFKSAFYLNPENDASPGVTLSDEGFNDGLWIRDYSIEVPNIENEDETHIKIYF